MNTEDNHIRGKRNQSSNEGSENKLKNETIISYAQNKDYKRNRQISKPHWGGEIICDKIAKITQNHFF